jgi:hypothetical protein
VVDFTHRPLYTLGKEVRIPKEVGWGFAGLNIVEKTKFLALVGINSDSSIAHFITQAL